VFILTVYEVGILISFLNPHSKAKNMYSKC